MFKSKFLWAVFIIPLFFSYEAMAHSGGTDKNGCHAMNRMTWDMVEQVEFWDMRVHCHDILSPEEVKRRESPEYQRKQTIIQIQVSLGLIYGKMAEDGIIGKNTLLAMNHYVWDNFYKFSYLDGSNPLNSVGKDNIDQLDLEHFKTLLAIEWSCGKDAERPPSCNKYYRPEGQHIIGLKPRPKYSRR